MHFPVAFLVLTLPATSIAEFIRPAEILTWEVNNPEYHCRPKLYPLPLLHSIQLIILSEFLKVSPQAGSE